MVTTRFRDKFLPNPKLKLREQLAEVCRFRHFSHRTEGAYWHWIKGFILFHGKRHPREMGAAEVQAYLSHLASARDVAPATQRQALNAIVFLYGEVLGLELGRVKRLRRHAMVLAQNDCAAMRFLVGEKPCSTCMCFSRNLTPGYTSDSLLICGDD